LIGIVVVVVVVVEVVVVEVVVVEVVVVEVVVVLVVLVVVIVVVVGPIVVVVVTHGEGQVYPPMLPDCIHIVRFGFMSFLQNIQPLEIHC
jgi:hypothetical protein